MTELTFHDWVRAAGTTRTGELGRSEVAADFSVVAEVDGSEVGPTASREVVLSFPGPADVQGLREGAIRRPFPSPNAVGAEPTRSAYVELSAADLPWRYSPFGDPPASWLAVVAGAENSDLRVTSTADGSTVELVSARMMQALTWSSVRGAHVQNTVGDGDNVADALSRVVCPLSLPALSSCVAVVVPAFGPDGAPWPPDTTSVPAYFSWRFATGDGDDFLAIASRLRRRTVPGLGLADLHVEHGGVVTVPFHSALKPLAAGSIGGVDPGVGSAVMALSDDGGTNARPVFGAPDYVSPWASPTSAPFALQLAGDPRDRCAAGLGAADGIDQQEPLVRAVLEQAGHLHLAEHRLVNLSGGVVASRSIWRTRVPKGALDRLVFVGPALRGLMRELQPGAGGGASVSDLLVRPGYLPAGLLSSAARRMTRSRRASEREIGARAMLEAVQRRPLSDDFMPFSPDVYDDPSVKELLGSLPPITYEGPAPHPPHPLGHELDAQRLEAVADEIASVFDPTFVAPQTSRVVSTIHGLDLADAESPLEVCESLDVASWTFLRDRHREFLLHGLSDIPSDTITALVVDDRFVDAYMVGLNAQLLSELRFRNVPVAAGCTPIRRFWSKLSIDTATGNVSDLDDIVGVTSWGADTALGSVQHSTQVARQLVLLFRTALFHRYPATVVSLRPIQQGGRIWSTFGGEIADDAVFYGFEVTVPEDGSLAAYEVVLEDPPHGIRFVVPTTEAEPTGNSARWAETHLERPVQVIISGDYLDGDE